MALRDGHCLRLSLLGDLRHRLSSQQRLCYGARGMSKKRTPPTQTLDDARPMPAGSVRSVMTPRQLAQFLQVSPRTIAREIREGRIPFVRVRKQVRFIPEDVLRHLRKPD